MIPTLLYALACAALSTLLAWLLIRRGKRLLGVVTGLAPIGIMEAIMQAALHFRIQRCLQEACVAMGLAADCGLTEFGCTEWNILSALVLWAAGVVALGLYAIAVAILVAGARRRSQPATG